MRKSTQPSPSNSKESLLAKAESQAKRDRTRLIVMIVGLVGVVIAYMATTWQEKKHLQVQGAALGQEPGFTESVVVDAFDFSALEGRILDARPEDRVLLPNALTEPITDYVFGFNDAHFAALGVGLLTPEVRATLEANPGAERGRPLRVRGWLEEIKSRERLDGKTEYKGWLRDEAGALTHFIAMAAPGEVIYGDYIRLDGLFVKLYRAEDHAGGWASGPLLVGAQLVKSYPPFEPDSFDPGVLRSRLAAVSDDTATNSTGLDGSVFKAQWLLMDFAKTAAYAAIDWEKDAVELDNETMTEMLKYGSDWRFRLAADGIEDPRAAPDPQSGQRPLLQQDLIPIPIRIPVCKNMGINTMDPGENPSRLEKITMGWLGNWTWTNHAGVIKFVLPEDRPDLTDMKEAELVQGKGFFLKNHNYESKDHGTRTAPYFVLTELEVFHPVPDNLAQNIMWGVLILILFLIALFPVLLMRDRKRSEALHRDLSRRKQERRRRLAAEQPQA
jgi:hypothetical protein